MSASIDALVAEAKAGRGKGVYLLHGEEFLAKKGAEALIDALVPANQRDLNVTTLEAAASPAEVARDLATIPMFRGEKVTWLRDPEFLAPKKAGKSDQLGRLRELWGQGREKEAVRRLLALAQKAGLDAGKATAAAWDDAAGITATAEDLTFCRDAAKWAVDHGVNAPATDSGELERLLERGIPKGHHLVVSAHAVDGRLGLVKKLEGAGVAVSFKPEGREGRDVGALAAELLAPLGKRLQPGATARLSELVGGAQVRRLAAEIEKLALYVGDRPTIEAADVDAVVERSAEVEFLLSNSVEKRDLRGALEGLAQLLEGGGAPLQALGSLSTCVRQLLAANEALAATGGKMPGFGAQAAGFVAAYAESGLKFGNPNAAKFKAEAARRFTRTELVRALSRCAQLDVELKRGGGRLELERFLVALCGAKGAAPSARR